MIKGVSAMKKQTVEFATVTKNGVVKQIGRSSILAPKTNYSGTGIRWFDDTKLIKKGGANDVR